MEETNNAIELAMKEFRKQYGADAQLEEGDEFATVFEDGILIIALEEGSLNMKFLLGEPFRVNEKIGIPTERR